MHFFEAGICKMLGVRLQALMQEERRQRLRFSAVNNID
jgi:hypothetical protein